LDIFSIIQGTLPWQPILGTKWLFTFVHRCCIPKRIGISQSIPMGALTASVIWLHRVEIWWSSVQ